MSVEKLRAWWAFRQGLLGDATGKSPGEILQATGWVRGLGGVAPYLALFARGGISREAADEAAAKLEIHELPAARGCTYVVPACDFAVALKAGEPFEWNEMKVAAKLGVTDKEIAKLCDAVLDALKKGPLEPDEIRGATGKASRSLGEEGKKKGLSTTLPLAIGLLQASGEIRRVSTNGRFDQQRYRYALWRPNPLEKSNLTAELANIELARRFFSWAGPATLDEFQTFAGSSKKAAQAAMEPLKLDTIDGDRLILAEQRDEFESFKIPKQARYALLASIDGITLFRRGLKDVTDDKKLAETKELGNHSIVDRGRIVGLWEFDPEANAIVWAPLIPKNKDLEKAVARTEAFIREQLGDARSYSLDSAKSRTPRIAALRKLAAK
ncbi:MAG TPA: crosslink repair DNA glycosylase YcaQ family protein [Bryobacteraceae bacterium]|nr:crosslink repair DNA glycosylase YcaQ family protein [Bryobacteraceae bacterium]